MALANLWFQERVLSTKGGREFLLACGFEEKDLNNNGQQERFLEIPDNKAVDTQSLIQALEMLQTSQAVPLKLSRNAAVRYFHLLNFKIAGRRILGHFVSMKIVLIGVRDVLNFIVNLFTNK